MYYMYVRFDTWNLLPSWRLFGHPEAAEELGLFQAALCEKQFSPVASWDKHLIQECKFILYVLHVYIRFDTQHFSPSQKMNLSPKRYNNEFIGSWLFYQSIAQS